jgi:hypothetical protein
MLHVACYEAVIRVIAIMVVQGTEGRRRAGQLVIADCPDFEVAKVICMCMDRSQCLVASHCIALHCMALHCIAPRRMPWR